MESERESCKRILKKYIKKSATVNQIESRIFNLSENNTIYCNIMMEIIIILKNGLNPNEIISILDKEEFNWKNKSFNNIKKSIEEQHNFIVKPFEVDEGVLECGKCGSKKTFSYTKQTRGGDESTTVFATCSICGNNWKM